MEKLNLTEALKKLEEINEWFDRQEEVDVEQGLEKVKQGVKLVKASQSRLQEIQNEFEEIKKDMVTEGGQIIAPASIDDSADQNEPTNIEEIPF